MSISYRRRPNRGRPPTHALCGRCLRLVEALRKRRWPRANEWRTCCHCERPTTACVVIPMETPGVECLTKHRRR